MRLWGAVWYWICADVTIQYLSVLIHCAVSRMSSPCSTRQGGILWLWAVPVGVGPWTRWGWSHFGPDGTRSTGPGTGSVRVPTRPGSALERSSHPARGGSTRDLTSSTHGPTVRYCRKTAFHFILCAVTGYFYTDPLNNLSREVQRRSSKSLLRVQRGLLLLILDCQIKAGGGEDSVSWQTYLSSTYAIKTSEGISPCRFMCNSWKIAIGESIKKTPLVAVGKFARDLAPNPRQ